ncbi:MAG: HAMP domain-containing histidine kinase [Clostridiales bacterium]|jgi:signal transduction histidine kinase|nr:HAMP domain-containing histidine kinase [Clostridiales bacterium]
MFKFRTIFAKQFAASFATVILCLTILSVGITGMMRGFFIDQKTAILKTQGAKIAARLVARYSSQFGKFVIDPMVSIRLDDDYQSIQEYADVSFIITDANFICFGRTTDVDSSLSGRAIDIPAPLRSVTGGEAAVYLGTMAGVFEGETMTVASPLMKDGSFLGAVFISVSAREFQDSMTQFMKILFLCAALAVTGAFALIFVTSRTISKPIRDVSAAAKEIAAGSFGKRLAEAGEDEVGQLARSFNEMADSLDSQEIKRREFIGNISHDLRSPLTSVKGFLTAILDGTIPPEDERRYLAIILEETERLGRLASDIVDVSRIQNMAIELELTVFDLSDLIRRTLALFETRVLAKGISLGVALADERTYVRADRDKIGRVIFNLVDNAVKFSGSGGEVSVETSLVGESVRIIIRDDGRGISAEDQKKIFDRFYKADQSRGEVRFGSGVGLSIVREFARAHGASISIRSATGRGSEFSFDLPIVDVD